MESKIFFVTVTTPLPLVVTAVSRIHNDSLNFADVWDTVRAHQRLGWFCFISAWDKKLSFLFDRGKTQPTPPAVYHPLVAAADKFERALCGLAFYFFAPVSGCR